MSQDLVLSSDSYLTSSGRPLRKASQKCLELFRKSSQKHSEGVSRKKSQKTSEDKTKAVVLASQKNFKSNSKATGRRQSAFCMICKKGFNGKRKLNDHNTKHHFSRHCPNCPKTFQQTRKFILHLQSHLEDHPFECQICLECFNKQEDLLTHKKIHKNPRRLVCEVCSEVFPHRGILRMHYIMHNGPPYICENCGASFSNSSDISVHLRNHVHRCLLCPKEVVAFPSNYDLTCHVMRVHQKKECDSNESKILETLEPEVNIGNVNLDEDSGSDSMEDLPSSDNEETGADVDGNYQRDAVESVYKLKRKDKFICFICFDLYPSSELLRSHMEAHKWYPCSSCPKFFANSEALLQHRCDFVEVPSFRCEICNTKTKCENCLKSCIKMRNGVLVPKTNALQSFVSRLPELPSIPSNYCNVTDRSVLYNFIEHIKSQKEPLDIESFSHIGFHYKCLEQILENPRVRCLFPMEHIPYLEDLYSKFQDLSLTLCSQLNHSLAL